MTSLGFVANFDLELVSVIMVKLSQFKLRSSRSEGTVGISAFLHVLEVKFGCSRYMSFIL